jgi:hypothetical protein
MKQQFIEAQMFLHAMEVAKNESTIVRTQPTEPTPSPEPIVEPIIVEPITEPEVEPTVEPEVEAVNKPLQLEVTGSNTKSSKK